MSLAAAAGEQVASIRQTDRQTDAQRDTGSRERQARVHNDFPFITVTEARMHACAIAC